MSKWHPGASGGVLGGVDWARFSIVLLKPDCLRRGMEDKVLSRISPHAEILALETLTVQDWQIYVHYADLLVDADWFSIDVAGSLRRMYVGQDATIALVHGSDCATPARIRSLLGHYDPSRAAAGTIRGDLGIDSRAQARAESRLVENLVHSSDDPAAVCRDFGTWFGARRYQLLSPAPPPDGHLPREDM